MTHRDCGGHFEQFVIREHSYCFMRCDKCRYVLGGEKVQKEINRLMAIKVRPTIRRA
jgi:hypothetical protein